MLGISGIRRRWGIIIALLGAAVLAVVPANSSQAKTLQAGTTTFTNPLNMIAPGHGNGIVESCADPTVLHSQTAGDNYWYMYCTKDPLNGEDRDSSSNFIFHNISMHRSLDLVNWEYVGDAFATVPAPGVASAALFAPEVIYRNNQYYLYFVITDVTSAVSGTADPNCNSDNGIFVATSTTPTGPWTANATPVVAPRYNGDPSKQFGQLDCNFFATLDPDVITAEGQNYIYYGSYYGGIQARPLSADGFTTDPATAVQITIPNRYEGAEVTHHNGYYYLYASATNCCNGPLTGYTVFVGRSTSPMGPFVDREGVALTTGRVGGTPVLSMNGNQWVGPGHNTVFTDFAGKEWTIYHAVNRNDPYFTGAPGFTKRPALMDPIDYVDGFPTVRGGKWISDRPISGPAAQPGEKSDYTPTYFKPDQPGALIPTLSDSFNGNKLNMKQWTWVDNGTPVDANVSNGSFNFYTQNADLHFGTTPLASVLTEPTPTGDYVVEVKVTLNLPPEGCCYNYVQAGMLIYGDNYNYIKLTQTSIWETRQTELGKQVYPVPDGYPQYGNTVVGPPNLTTWLRIVKTRQGMGELYTPYTSRDGIHWVHGGSWTGNLGSNAKIGLIAMGGQSGVPTFLANFDHVRVYQLAQQ